jgi:hypothetical protein
MPDMKPFSSWTFWDMTRLLDIDAKQYGDLQTYKWRSIDAMSDNDQVAIQTTVEEMLAC